MAIHDFIANGATTLGQKKFFVWTQGQKNSELLCGE
jgi:hypothetical protein